MDTTKYLLRRNDLFLSERYDWGSTPNVFPECYFQQVLEMSMNFKDRPQEVGELIGSDLDAVQWHKIEGLTISPAYV